MCKTAGGAPGPLVVRIGVSCGDCVLCWHRSSDETVVVAPVPWSYVRAGIFMTFFVLAVISYHNGGP